MAFQISTSFSQGAGEIFVMCQCCLSTTNLRSMLHEQEFNDRICADNYCAMLRYSFSIQVDRSFSKLYICLKCIDDLHSACNFREKVEKSQETILRQLILIKDKSNNGHTTTPHDDVSKIFHSDELRPDGFEDNFIDSNERNLNNVSTINSEGSIDSSTSVNNIIQEIKPEKLNHFDSASHFKVTAKSNRKLNKNRNRKRKESLPYKLDRNNLQCAECTQLFLCFKDLQNHMHSHYPNHVCHICGNFFAIEESLKNHIRRQHSAPRFKCLECGKMYRQHNALSNHITTIHRGEKLVYKCTECSEKFHTFHKRVMHMIYQHGLGNRLTYKCQECPRVFIHCSELRAHIRRDHRLERRYQCEKCNHAFFQKKILKEHMVCHSGERNYQCEICSKAFGRKDTLRCHLKTHDICKSCFVCGQSFTLLSSLKKHEKTHEVVEQTF